MIPQPKSMYRAIFCVPDTRSVRRSGNGRIRMMASVNIFRAAFAYARAEIPRQRASPLSKFQIELMGTHCQMTIGVRIATVVVTKTIVAMT